MVAVVPVLVGPLQTLLALLPALLVAVGTLVMALFTPRGLKRTARFFWRQKLFSALLLAAGFSFYTGIPFRYLWGGSRAGQADLTQLNGEWPMFRGGPLRTGALLDDVSPPNGSSSNGDDGREPASGKLIWNWAGEPTVYSSPAVVGDQVIVTTAGGIGPFSPAGRGAIVSLDATTGRERWRYAPDDFRATFSSAVVGEGHVVAGEGLHLVQDARVSCLDLNGQLQWEFRTKSHVESTPCIANGCVYVGAGDDGFYCLALHDPVAGSPRVVWRLAGEEYPDCEAPPLVVDGTVYFGLGEGGHAVCAVDARTGRPRWRVATPYPVFAPPTLVPGTLAAQSAASTRSPASSTSAATTSASVTSGSSTSAARDGQDRLVVAMGNGNFVQSAAELLESRLAVLRDQNASEAEIAEVRRRYGPAGAVWILDAATGDKLAEFTVKDTVLGAVAWARDRLVFGARDGHVYAIDLQGQLLAEWPAREPIVTSPCVGPTRLFVTTTTGRLHALDLESFEPSWDASLGAGTTFLSSPVLAQGRIFVGTPDQGVMCVGGKQSPAAFVWSNGESGGVADHGRLPESAVVRETLSASHARPAKIWTPAPSRQCLITACEVGDATIVTGHLVTSLEREANPETRKTSSAWSGSQPRLALPPLVVGDHCLLVTTTLAAGGAAEVICLSTTTGETVWRQSVGSVAPRAAALDASRLYLIVDDALVGLSVDSGQPSYKTPVRVRSPRCIDVAHDCVVVAGLTGWQAFDGPTGRSLKVEMFEMKVESSPDDAGDEEALRVRLYNDRVLIATKQAIEARRLADNESMWRVDVSSTGPLALHHGRVARRLTDGSVGVWQIADGAEVVRTEVRDAGNAERRDDAAGIASNGALPPLLDARHVYVQSGQELVAVSLADGSLTPWASLADADRPAVPMVALRDHAFLMNAAGECRILGPPQE